jgi:hypothetical protein
MDFYLYLCKMKMKYLIMMKRLCFLSLMLCLLCVACEKDDIIYITVNYPITDKYTNLDVSSAFDVVVCDTVSEARVTVKGGQHKNVIFKVENGTLKIGFKSGLFNWFHGSGKVLLPRNSELCDVELSGASSFRGDVQGDEVDVEVSGASNFYGNVTGSEVSIDFSGASDFKGNINADKIEMEISGSSKISGAGSCTEILDAEVSGSSTVDAFGLECRRVTAKVSGSSKVKISCCESITGSISGSSDLYYKALPGCNPVVNCSTSGGSEVHRD